MVIRRRDQADWLLIDQVEHARLATELAVAWQEPAWQSLCEQTPVLDAIAHHDDGWLDWDPVPGLHPDSGHPRDFTEMRLEDSTALWERGIETCRGFAPVAGEWVSRHFCWLANQAIAHRTQEDDRLAAKRFLERQRALFPRDSGSDGEGDGFLWLQMFDRLSLWFCCDPVEKARTLPVPTGRCVSVETTSNQRLHFSPWPFRSSHIQFTARARRIPARRFASTHEFHTSLIESQEENVEWFAVANEAENRSVNTH